MPLSGRRRNWAIRPSARREGYEVPEGVDPRKFRCRHEEIKVTIDGTKQTDPQARVRIEGGEILRAGKRRFARLVVK